MVLISCVFVVLEFYDQINTILCQVLIGVGTLLILFASLVLNIASHLNLELLLIPDDDA